MAIAFSHLPLDRASHRRRDAAWMDAARHDARTRFVAFDGARPLLRDGAAAYLAPEAVPSDASAVFLGVDENGAAIFAVALSVPPAGTEFQELRAAAMGLSGRDIAILGCAKSVLDWHARHGFCANCGAPTLASEGGWKRECPACKAEHFPRLDPVVIMLAVHGEQCVLGRQARFLPHMVSALAGYVEPGETVEEACARELHEEVGVVATSMRYLASQPWPFPSSLMIGLIAEVSGGPLTIDHHELEDARWFTREEARALVEGRHAAFTCPPPLAIAHHLIKAWAYE